MKKHSDLTTEKQRTERMIFSMGGTCRRSSYGKARIPPNEKKSLPSGLLGEATVVERSAASRSITNAKRCAH
ncbi:MAG: hypothetical protein PVJ69_05030 [Desulfobacteraceae bacterium]